MGKCIDVVAGVLGMGKNHSGGPRSFSEGEKNLQNVQKGVASAATSTSYTSGWNGAGGSTASAHATNPQAQASTTTFNLDPKPSPARIGEGDKKIFTVEGLAVKMNGVLKVIPFKDVEQHLSRYPMIVTYPMPDVPVVAPAPAVAAMKPEPLPSTACLSGSGTHSSVDKMPQKSPIVKEVALSPIVRTAGSDELRSILSGDVKLQWAFGYSKENDLSQNHVAIAEFDVTKDQVWFVGDIHGDVLALKDCVTYIDAMSDENSKIVFLGDIVDRHEHHIEAVATLAALAVDRPGRILWIAGNHDDALEYDEANCCFSSKAEPSEFKEYLNAHPECHDLGLAFIRFVKDLPRALVIKNGGHGLLAVHGGFPHDGYDGDQHPDARAYTISSFASLAQNNVQSDFMWARIEDKKRSRFAAGKRDHGLGYENFKNIQKELAMALGVKIDKVVFGHQHPSQGFQHFKSYEDNAGARVVCIQSQYLDDPGLGSDVKHTRPSVVHYGPNDEMTIIRLTRSDVSIDDYYARMPEPARSVVLPGPTAQTVGSLDPTCRNDNAGLGVESQVPVIVAAGGEETPPQVMVVGDCGDCGQSASVKEEAGNVR